MSEDLPAQASSGELTRLLQAWTLGDESALEALWPLVYDDLKAIARSVRRRHSGMALRGPQTTTLLHEAALRLLPAEVGAKDRRHFFAIAAQAMRFVLVDEARRRLAKKRAAEENALELSADPASAIQTIDQRPEEILAIHQALTKLSKLNPRYVKMVELRYFAGMTVEEVADVLEVSTPTVKRDWQAARRWLHAELKPRPAAP